MLATRTPKVHIRKDPAFRRVEIRDEAVRVIGRLGFHGFTVRELALSGDRDADASAAWRAWDAVAARLLPSGPQEPARA